MGIQAISRPDPERAVPKALCPKCHRPIAMLRTGKCAYCGETVPGLSKARELGTQPAAEVLAAEAMMEEGKVAKGGGRSRLIWQILGFVAMALLAGSVMGTCMKT